MTVIPSLAAGLAAVAFLLMTNLLFEKTYVLFASYSKTVFLAASFLTITSTSLAVGYLLNVFSPEAAGSGIPQIKTAYWKELGFMDFKTVIVKFFAGILSIGGGNSLGREGPSVYLGSGVSSRIDGIFGAPPRGRRASTLIGASAGLAAAFNTPIAAITFVIEEIIGDLNSRYLGRVVLSSVLGAFVVYAIIGKQPAFSLPPVENVSLLHYTVLPVVALISSLAGIIFQRSTISVRARLKKQKMIPMWLLPLCAGIITWIIGSGVFLSTGKIGVFGLGYRDLSDALDNNFEWKIAGIMVAAKLVATIVGYSFGGCGGIFSPSLFIGGLTGYFIGGLAGNWMPLTPSDRIVLAAVGMSSCLCAIVRAPLTSMLIVFEMTHQFSLVPGLMLGTLISQALSHRFLPLNFYDALLVQDGHELHKIRPPVDIKSWQNLPVSAIANPNTVALKSFSRKEMADLLDKYPYGSFPVMARDRIEGIVRREDIEAALESRGAPEVHPVITCYPDQTVKEIGKKFVDSTVHVLLVVERNTKKVIGIITLHDLIRAQDAIQN